MTAEGDEEGGDPACWAHLLDDGWAVVDGPRFDDIGDGLAAEEPAGSCVDGSAADV